ncbi:hypothetical protein [Campylobacter concisus]|uniref:hypothetical protein n=1 Tax=Campylobacter concisus TaxID=199 RepID=UPI000CD7E4CC|nr:hypothetical protein [Campylobacter concisus]
MKNILIAAFLTAGLVSSVGADKFKFTSNKTYVYQNQYGINVRLIVGSDEGCPDKFSYGDVEPFITKNNYRHKTVKLSCTVHKVGERTSRYYAYAQTGGRMLGGLIPDTNFYRSKEATETNRPTINELGIPRSIIKVGDDKFLMSQIGDFKEGSLNYDNEYELKDGRPNGEESDGIYPIVNSYPILGLLEFLDMYGISTDSFNKILLYIKPTYSHAQQLSRIKVNLDEQVFNIKLEGTYIDEFRPYGKRTKYYDPTFEDQFHFEDFYPSLEDRMAW